MSPSVIKTKSTKLEVLQMVLLFWEKQMRKIYLLFQIYSLIESIPGSSPETYKIINADYKMVRF